MGAPSNNFALLPEYALSSAILSINLNAIGNTTYDLPTLDDENRAGVTDANDPFGGDNGKNQAKLVTGGPVQVYAPGFRNPYDLVITSKGRMYAVDNGANAGWGDVPILDSNGNATNQVTSQALPIRTACISSPVLAITGAIPIRRVPTPPTHSTRPIHNRP